MKNTILLQIEDAIRNHQQAVTVEQSRMADDIRNAIRRIMRHNPDIFWFSHQYHFDEERSILHFQYTFSDERVKTIRQSINDVVNNDFGVEYVKTLPPQKQIVYVYKWLVNYCNYNVNSAYNQGIYSVFVRRNSVCTGYAKAAQYLFNLLGIESRLVFGRLHNDKENGRHCWNIIKVDNQYYHFDTCLGDSILDGVAIIAGAQKLYKVDGINYNFLCVSTDEILKTRSIEDVETLPLCMSSWSKEQINSLVGVGIKQRESARGCLLSHIGSTADIYLCSKDKNAIFKVFRSNSQTTSEKEFHYMQQTKGCLHVLQCNEQYTDISKGIIAIEQSTPIVDLLCSHYYELSLKGLIKLVTDIAKAWIECRDRGVLYRDIHLCNIYRSNDGIFKLGDFGNCTDNFKAKEIVGNQWFMAPETFASGVFTEASAVYSISMVMYFILNGLRPAFWKSEHEDEALRKRMNGNNLPLPIGCGNLPSCIKEQMSLFIEQTLAASLGKRLDSVKRLICELQTLASSCNGEDYIIHRRGVGLDFDIDAGNKDRLDARRDYISPNVRYGNMMSDEVERMCTSVALFESVDVVEDLAKTTGSYNDDYVASFNIDQDKQYEPNISTNISEFCVDVVENFAVTMASRPINRESVQNVTFYSDIPMTFKTKESFWGKFFGKRYYEVYSSIFAPLEVKRKSHLQVQVYLHLYEETEKVKSLAKESDKNAERRDYIPLSLKLRKGDKVDVELNVYGESLLMSERKSVIWKGSFTKCSFNYFVPKDIDIDELSCEANIFVNGAMIGEMRFITRIVEVPRNLNTEILTHRFNRIFISYAHQDAQQIKLLALAYKAQGVDYFYDRDSLAPGDVYEEKIFNYIDTSDLFVLCWSKNASMSDYVAKEKGRALLRAYPQLSLKDATLKICPISIEPRAELPNDMKEVYNFEVI